MLRVALNNGKIFEAGGSRRAACIPDIPTMKKRRILLTVVALVTLGSGVLNLLSVIGPSLPHRRALLRQLFPLEFLQLSRFLTLLIGFALVISSLNIYKRKKRALQVVLLLASASVLFHLTKGLDYEEAIFSLALVIILFLTRKHFTVKSSIPDFRQGAIRLAIALVVAFAYGVAGFWLLEPREFGINFNWLDSIQRTTLFLTLVGDPRLVPHTRYALWFLDSLYLIASTAIGYGLFLFFRPVAYRFGTLPHERAEAAAILHRYGRCLSDYFKLWPDKSYFLSDSNRSFLAYRVGAHFAVVLGDPVGPEEEMESIIRDFADFCDENDWRLAFYQTPPDLLPVYQRLGFRKLKIGDDAIVDLKAFSLEGKPMKKLRLKVNSLDRAGMRTAYYDPPLTGQLIDRAQEVSEQWLQIPGRRERSFTLGRFDRDYLRDTPLFTVEDKQGTMLAFVNVIPSYAPGEVSCDLMRHRPGAPNGVMDYLFVKFILHERQKGSARFNLSMVPMAGFREKEEASLEERAVHYFFQRLNFLFSYRGLREYKAKFATSWEPRYAVYRNALDLPRLAVALGIVAEVED